LRSEETVHATTVSSFTFVSREPLLVSVCLASSSRTLRLLERTASFAVSVLGRDQAELADRFSDPARPTGTGHFTDLPHHLSAYGPVPDGAAAWVGCRLHALHRCGDHHIVVGRVAEAGATEHAPLVRHDGLYH
jgi:flavin reductase (DIM6/NTAB) family NADH-FMN oxidoreductase RutF